MARRTRQISLKECYDILKLEKDADMAALKRTYRRRAFELHPDLHPDNPEASHDFQLLNEAYVALSAMLEPRIPQKQRTLRHQQNMPPRRVLMRPQIPNPRLKAQGNNKQQTNRQRTESTHRTPIQNMMFYAICLMTPLPDGFLKISTAS